MRIDIEPKLEGVMTNGDVIKALFPNVKFVYFEDKAKGILMSLDWWNTPYRNNKEDKNHDADL